MCDDPAIQIVRCENDYMRSINVFFHRGDVHRMQSLTATIFIHKHVSVCWDDKRMSRALRTRYKIPKGTLILLEHCLSGTMHDVSVGISADPKLFRELAPRSRGLTTKSEGEKRAKRNAFASHIANEFLVSPVIASMNHSCFSNCGKGVIMKDLGPSNAPADFMYCFTLRDISPGEEMTLMYSARDVIHAQPVAGFKCTCDAPPGVEMVRDDVEERPDALKMVLDYIDSDRLNQVIANQYLIRKTSHKVNTNEPFTIDMFPTYIAPHAFELMKLMGMDTHTILDGQVVSSWA